jgi:hypothetical protein
VSGDLARRAVALLEDALSKPPEALRAEVDEVERAVVALRDHLIARLRQTPQTPDPALRHALDQVNVALSLVVGLEYPVGGMQRDLIDQARATLTALLAEGLP